MQNVASPQRGFCRLVTRLGRLSGSMTTSVGTEEYLCVERRARVPWLAKCATAKHGQASWASEWRHGGAPCEHLGEGAQVLLLVFTEPLDAPARLRHVAPEREGRRRRSIMVAAGLPV